MSIDDLHDLDEDELDPHKRDFDNPARLLAELRDIVTTDGRYGLDFGNDPADRALALAEATFLVGRLAVLAACDWRERQPRQRVTVPADAES